MAALTPPSTLNKEDKQAGASRDMSSHTMAGNWADVTRLRPGRRFLSIGCEAYFYDGRL